MHLKRLAALALGAFALGTNSFPVPAEAAPSAQGAYQAADAALNAAWAPAMRAAKARRTDTQLRAAQLAWVAFKDAEAKALNLAEGPGQGVDWLVAETQARTEHLRELARGRVQRSPDESAEGTPQAFFAEQDAALNAAWAKAMQRPAYRQAEARRARTAAQLAWIRYRDAEAAFRFADGGMPLLWAKARLSGDRAHELRP